MRLGAGGLGAMRPSYCATGDHLLILGPGDLDPQSLDAFIFQFDRGAAGAGRRRCRSRTRPSPTWARPSSMPRLRPSCLSSEELDGGSGRLTLRPIGRLTAGHSFRLQLEGREHPLERLPPGAQGTHRSYNEWSGAPKEFFFATRPQPGQPVTGPMQGANHGAFDLLQLGNLVMVATGQGEIQAVDATTTTSGDHGGSYTVHATCSSAASQARALATDGHGRLFANLLVGSTWMVKAFRMEDVRKAPEGGTFAPVQGGVRTAYALGTDTGATGSEWLAQGAMPVGTPMDMEVVVQDETGDTLALDKFLEQYSGNVEGTGPDDEGIVTFTVQLDATSQIHPRATSCDGECPYDCFQRVSVDNLTTGQTWSQDVASDGCDSCPAPAAEDNGHFTVTARAGDRLRVRRNVLTLGYVAVLGSGITVLDLNRFYRLSNPPGSTMPGGAQCGRRLGSYEGQQLDLTGCIPGLSQGISLTPAVAALGQSGGADSGGVRGQGQLSTYSPLLHVGALATAAATAQPGALSGLGPFCIRSLDIGPFDASSGRFGPGTTPATLRDVTTATDVSWLHRGITGSFEGRFSPPDDNREPTELPGDLMFLSLGEAGIFVFDVSDRFLDYPIGLLRYRDHSAYHLQVDPVRHLLFAGGFGDGGASIIDVWDLADVNAAPDFPCADGQTGCPAGTNTSPRPLMTLRDVPWTTNHLGIDQAGTGLLETFTGNGVTAVPFDAPRFTMLGLYLAEGVSLPVQPEQLPGALYLRQTARFLPLGVPMESSLHDETALPTARRTSASPPPPSSCEWPSPARSGRS